MSEETPYVTAKVQYYLVQPKKGWKGQSIRHSNAKKFGRAGGVYSSKEFQKERKEHPWATDEQVAQIVKDHTPNPQKEKYDLERAGFTVIAWGAKKDMTSDLAIFPDAELKVIRSPDVKGRWLLMSRRRTQ